MILALDIASTTGWAVGDDRPVSGSIICRGDLGAKAARLRDGLNKLVDEHNPDLMIFEAPFLTARGGSSTIRTLLALCGVAEMVAHDRGVIPREVPSEKWRKHFLGLSHAPRHIAKSKRRQWLKREAQKRCDERGWGWLSDDEADACGVWDYAKSLRDPDYAVMNLPLMGGAR